MESEALKQLDQSGAAALQWLDEYAEKGLGFVEEQAPLLCQEIINLRIVTSVLIIILCSVVAIAAIWFCRTSFKQVNPDKPSDEDGPWIAVALVSAVFSVVSLMGACVWIYNLAVVLVAPRIYLLEYFTDLARRM